MPYASQQKPTYHRFSFLLLVVLVAWPGAARAADPIAEAEAVRAALDRPAVERAIEGRVEGELAEAKSRYVVPNPVVAYQREQMLTPDQQVEEQLTVSQQIDVSGSFALRAAASEQRAEAAGLEGKGLKRRIAAEARRRFYGVLFRQGRHAALVDWVARLGAARDVMRRREVAGDVSAYPRRRLERELRRAQAELARAQAERERAWYELLAFTGPLEGPEAWPRVRGELLPRPPPAADIDARVPLRPEIRALGLEVEAAALEEEAADLAWVPQLGLIGGWRSVVVEDRRLHGFVAGVSLSLPIFDHGQGPSARAEALMKRTRAEAELTITRSTAEARAAHAAATRLQRAAETFEREAIPAAGELVRMAERGYEAGELRLLELLDAHRAAADDRLEALELAHVARLARIDLDWLAGVQP